MQPFIGHGTPLWPPDARVLHLYLVPDRDHPANAGFFELAERHRRILTQRFAHLVAPVQPPWLHSTVQMVTEPGAPSLSEHKLADLIDQLTSRLTPLAPFILEAAPHVGASGSGLDLAPDGDFDRLVEITGTVLDTVLGSSRAAYRTNAPHITTSYCHTAGDSGPVASALRASRPSRAQLAVTSVSLVDVVQDAEHHTYRWEPPVAVIALQGSR
ncbi:hypothetical protein [Nocardiopsis sp. CNT312]|uniref:hypothetical protein n=1 Tax=Nocardiopsis sp. CNT312 TaxID=1137268 RepID=UPI00048ECE0D|nr:hypothetical protein [Nocardiopsis sp. CNT312]